MSVITFLPPVRKKLKLRYPPVRPPKEKPPKECRLCLKSQPWWHFGGHGSGLICLGCKPHPGAHGYASTAGRWEACQGGAFDVAHMNEILAVCQALERRHG